MTDLRVTQLTAEAWVSSPAATLLRQTQVSAEAWVQSESVTEIRVTQFAVEAWVASHGPPLFGRSLSKTSGRLGQYSGVVGLAGSEVAQLKAHGTLNVVGAFTSLSAQTISQLHATALLTISELPPQPAFDWLLTVISQYSNSPILLQLLYNFFQYVDPTTDLFNFYKLIWNVDTAIGYGLDVWGRIVGVSRVLELSDIGTSFGFEEATDAVGFGQGPFWAGTGSSSSYFLSDNAYRILIFAKALANISDGSIQSINQLLINLFGSGPSVGGNAYVVDNNDMTMVYHFDFSLTPVQLAIISQSGVLPKPTGVSVTVSAP